MILVAFLVYHGDLIEVFGSKLLLVYYEDEVHDTCSRAAIDCIFLEIIGRCGRLSYVFVVEVFNDMETFWRALCTL